MSNILNEISQDLNINKFESESNDEYAQRVIYSALAIWARVLVLGKSYTDLNEEIETEYNNVDIMHIQTRLAQIVYGLLLAIKHKEEWLIETTIEAQCNKLSSSIIKNLLFCYELSQLNSKRRLIITPSRIVNFNNNQLILGGTEWKDINRNLCTAGLGRWLRFTQNPSNYKVIFNIPRYTANEYFEKLIDNIFWKESKLDERYEVFKVGTGGRYKNSWKDYSPSKLQNGVNLLKNIDGGYILVNKLNNEISTARLDKWYYDEKEIYRIMYAIDSYNKTPAVFKARVYKDHVMLNCNSRLPNPEMRVLLVSSWPKRFYNDIYYRIIPKFLWDEIRIILINLGIEIQFY